MTYSAWSVVFGEQPSAAKWNILGTNDAHFNNLIGETGGGLTKLHNQRTQVLTSNATTDDVVLQWGFSFIQGAGNNSSNKAITFPTAFSSVIGVYIGEMGYTDGSNPTNVTSPTLADGGNIAVIFARSVTTTGFDAYYTLDSSATLASNLRKCFSWFALGTIT